MISAKSNSRPTGKQLFLGHQRFSIIDLSPKGHQPMHNEDGSFWLNSNCDIYNFRELRQELSSSKSIATTPNIPTGAIGRR
jgi:asparagine synthetase B (glutamine-hydrolysing)